MSYLHSCRECFKVITEQSCITSLICVLNAKKSHADIQEYGWRALATLSAMHDDNRVRIAQQGGIDRILGALAGHNLCSGSRRGSCGAGMARRERGQ
jgi:hypothetical protein